MSEVHANSNLDLNVKLTIVEYYKKGRNVQQIANLLGITRSTVRRWIQRSQEGTLDRRNGGGRPSKAALKHKAILAQHKIQPPPELEEAAAKQAQSSSFYQSQKELTDPSKSGSKPDASPEDDHHDADNYIALGDVHDEPKDKRSKTTTFTEHEGPVEIALKGLSHNQLIDIIRGLIDTNPSLEDQIKIPQPDLVPLEEKLNCLQANIYRSLQSPHLVSKTDAWAYERVAAYLEEFEATLTKQGNVLLESRHWCAVLEYVFLAWVYVRMTPVWDAYHHNDTRRNCFKALANICLNALRNGMFDRGFLQDLQEKLQGMVTDSEDILYSFNFIQEQLNVNF